METMPFEMFFEITWYIYCSNLIKNFVSDYYSDIMIDAWMFRWIISEIIKSALAKKVRRMGDPPQSLLSIGEAISSFLSSLYWEIECNCSQYRFCPCFVLDVSLDVLHCKNSPDLGTNPQQWLRNIHFSYMRPILPYLDTINI